MQSVLVKVEFAFWVTRKAFLAHKLAISKNLIPETSTEAPKRHLSGRPQHGLSSFTVTPRGAGAPQTGVLVGWEWPPIYEPVRRVYFVRISGNRCRVLKGNTAKTLAGQKWCFQPCDLRWRQL